METEPNKPRAVEEKQDQDAQAQVAIIGASYAGLTLANHLHLHSIPYTVFDCKSLPFTYITGGSEFNVPSYSYITEKLKLKSCGENQLQENSGVFDKDDHVDYLGPTREEVISTLLERVKNRLISSQNITRIEKRNQNSFYLHSQPNDSGFYSQFNYRASQESRPTSEKSIRGPYHIVVGADGVLSKCRTSALPGTYLIGDARWVNDRWYDLGLSRIREGADVALNDGIELGLLMTSTSISADAKRKFCAHRIYHQNMQRRLLLLTIILSIVLNTLITN